MKSLDHNLRALIFDLDGLLLDTEPMSRRAWKSALADWDYVIQDHQYFEFIGRNAQSVRQLLMELYGEEFPYEEVLRRRNEYVSQIITAQGICAKPGVQEILSLAREHALLTAIATSSPRDTVEEKLHLAGVPVKFDALVGGVKSPRESLRQTSSSRPRGD